MFITNNSFLCCNTISCLISRENGSKRYMNFATLAKKKDLSEISSPENKPIFPLKLASSKILIQSAIGIFALGFIDAGYSGDWSRIGVITTETEDLLRAAAFLIIPLCLFLIFTLSNKE
ncbi:hypothetical protein ACJIZ3_020697 [Penstemon smallii]|uniref:DUF7887 domain-containing protein n=1 Tax=Penstemon smallii TaxID=265156 RepID=A0ABD3SK85_9LAMI